MMINGQPVRLRRPKGEQGKPRFDAILAAVSGIDVVATPAWRAIAGPSDPTQSAEIDAVPEGVFEFGDNGFVAVATVYARLSYDSDGIRGSVPAQFPAEVTGHFDSDGTAVVDNVSVNTASLRA